MRLLPGDISIERQTLPSHLQELLARTSRTFALAIPLLPEPTRTDVTLAYLIFRIVDTLEDAEKLESGERVVALEEVDALLETPTNVRATNFAAKWSARNLTSNPWYEELLAHTPDVLDELSRRNPVIARLVLDHARRTAQGMASFLESGTPQLRSIAEIQRYCYFVAGVIGEMLTDIFAQRIAGLTVTSELRSSAQAFGEGLQLVNILKDADEDARCGRLFLPADMERSEVFELARRDLRRARWYIDRLKDAAAPPGYVAFTELPLQLAWATLDQVERNGAGAKVPRDEVGRILDNLTSGLHQGEFPDRSQTSRHGATEPCVEDMQAVTA